MPTKFSKASFPQTLKRNGVLVPLLDAYDRWDQEWEFKYEPKGSDDAWHPSGDCTPSALDLYEGKLKAERRAISPSLQRTFLVGHFWHQVIQKVIVEMGYAAPHDIERVGTKGWGPYTVEEGEDLPTWWEPYHWVRGQADICPLTLPRWSGLCDIKTMNAGDWLESERTGLLPSRFADKYEAQMNIYMDLFDQDRALILAVNKDSSKFIEFQFERNQTLIDAIYEKWTYVGDCLAKGVTPEPEMEFKLSYQGPIG